MANLARFYEAAKTDNIAFLKSHGNSAVFQCVNSEGYTLLHVACAHRRIKSAKYIISTGASINAKSAKEGTTALMFAVFARSVDHLVHVDGIDLNVQNSSKSTALILAASNGVTDIAQKLLECGAITDLQDENGDTALTWAAHNGNLALVKALTRHRAALDTVNNDGETALILAVGGGHEAVVRHLLEHGAAVDVRDKDGNSALYHAAFCGSISIVQLLMEHNAVLHPPSPPTKAILMQWRAALQLPASSSVQDLLGIPATVVAYGSSSCSTPISPSVSSGSCARVPEHALLRTGVSTASVGSSSSSAIEQSPATAESSRDMSFTSVITPPYLTTATQQPARGHARGPQLLLLSVNKSRHVLKKRALDMWMVQATSLLTAIVGRMCLDL